MKPLESLRTACATGRDCQMVTVRRGHLRWLLRAYEDAAKVMPCSECVHVTECKSRDVTAWCARLERREPRPAGGEE